MFGLRSTFKLSRFSRLRFSFGSSLFNSSISSSFISVMDLLSSSTESCRKPRGQLSLRRSLCDRRKQQAPHGGSRHHPGGEAQQRPLHGRAEFASEKEDRRRAERRHQKGKARAECGAGNGLQQYDQRLFLFSAQNAPAIQYKRRAAGM